MRISDWSSDVCSSDLLKTLDEKAKTLRQRKVTQLGELIVATGADALSFEELAGALLGAADTTDFVAREGWRKRGAAFFQGKARQVAGSARRQSGGDAARDRTPTSSSGGAGA